MLCHLHVHFFERIGDSRRGLVQLDNKIAKLPISMNRTEPVNRVACLAPLPLEKQERRSNYVQLTHLNSSTQQKFLFDAYLLEKEAKAARFRKEREYR